MKFIAFFPYPWLPPIALLFVLLGGFCLIIQQRRLAKGLLVSAGLLIFMPFIDQVIGGVFDELLEIVLQFIRPLPWWGQAAVGVVAIFTLLSLTLGLIFGSKFANKITRWLTFGRGRAVFWTLSIVAGCYLAYVLNAASGLAPVSTAPAGNFTAAPPLVLEPDSLGNLRIGAPYAEVAAALAGKIDRDIDYQTGSNCYYATSDALPDEVWLMFNNGNLARIDVRATTVTTGAGVHAGMSAVEAMDAYEGRLRVSPNRFNAGGSYLSWAPPTSRGFELVFETDGTHVVRIRAGREPEVGWLEGCL